MRDTKYADVTVSIRLPYTGDEASEELDFFKTRAGQLEQDQRFLASWYDFDYDPEFGNRLNYDEDMRITVSVNP